VGTGYKSRVTNWASKHMSDCENANKLPLMKLRKDGVQITTHEDLDIDDMLQVDEHGFDVR